MYRLVVSGSYSQTRRYLLRMQRLRERISAVLERNAAAGVAALSKATPVRTGLAAGSWSYSIKTGGSTCAIYWENTDLENGFPVAIMLQYGYGTGTGGFVQGTDYINPAIRPIFDKIADDVWKEVTSNA